MRKRSCSYKSDQLCLRRTKTVVSTRTRLVRGLQRTSLSGATFSRIFMNKHATSSLRLGSQRVFQTTSMLVISTMLDASRQFSLSTLRRKQVWSRVRGKDQKLELLASVSWCRNCWSLWHFWWVKSLRVQSLTNLNSRSLSIPTSSSWTTSNQETWRSLSSSSRNTQVSSKLTKSSPWSTGSSTL